MSAYSEAYSEALRTMLYDWAEENIGEAAKAYAELSKHLEQDPATTRSWYGFQGPVGHHIAWRGGNIAEAEVRTATAVIIKQGLEGTDEHEPRDPAEVLEYATKALRGLVGKALRDNGGLWHTTSAMAMGIAADDLGDSTWNGISMFPVRAEWVADEAVVPQELKDELKEANKAKQNVEGMLQRARSEHTRTSHEITLAGWQRDIERLQARRTKAISDSKLEV